MTFGCTISKADDFHLPNRFVAYTLQFDFQTSLYEEEVLVLNGGTPHSSCTESIQSTREKGIGLNLAKSIEDKNNRFFQLFPSALL